MIARSAASTLNDHLDQAGGSAACSAACGGIDPRDPERQMPTRYILGFEDGLSRPGGPVRELRTSGEWLTRPMSQMSWIDGDNTLTIRADVPESPDTSGSTRSRVRISPRPVSGKCTKAVSGIRTLTL